MVQINLLEFSFFNLKLVILKKNDNNILLVYNHINITKLIYPLKKNLLKMACRSKFIDVLEFQKLKVNIPKCLIRNCFEHRLLHK